MFCLFYFLENKDRTGEAKGSERGKSIEVKQTEKDKISFLYKNDAFVRWWRCVTKLFNLQFSDIKLVIRSLKYCLSKFYSYLTNCERAGLGGIKVTFSVRNADARIYGRLILKTLSMQQNFFQS